MKRINAFISGEVQGVGYREEVKRIAFELSIYGWVRNLEDGRVEITAEGENQSIEKFLEKININKYPIFVEKVEAKAEIYRGDLKSFKVIRDKDIQKEILSALSRGTVGIHEVKEVLLAVKQDTSAMLGKQDTTIHVLQSVKEDTSDMKSTLSRIEADVKDTKFSLSSFIEEKFRKQDGEIAEIKATLARMQAAG